MGLWRWLIGGAAADEAAARGGSVRGLELRNDPSSDRSYLGAWSSSFSSGLHHLWDDTVSKQVDKVLAVVGRSALASAKDPYAPGFVNALYDIIYHELCEKRRARVHGHAWTENS